MSRIVLLTLEYPPFKGGVAQYLKGLGDELDRAGHEFFVIGESGDVTIEQSFFSRYFWPKWILPSLRLANRIRDLKPDYVMISHVLPVGLMMLIIQKMTGIPFICVVHGLDIAKPRGIKRWFIKQVLGRASVVVCNSRFTKRVVDEYGTHADTIVVYPGVTSCDVPVSHREGYRILSVGRLVERKGFDTLIGCMPRVLAKCPDAQLTIAGDGPQRAELESLVASLGLQSSVLFEGGVERDRLHALYARSDLFCMLPRDIDGDVEGFGIVYLEAALHGLPVVAGGSGGVSEAVKHDVSGLVCDPTHADSITDAIVRLLSNEAMSVQMGRDARQRVRDNFPWRTTAQPLVSWLDQSELVSIVIPVYNHSAELKKCIASIHAQTHQNYEIIVVDDGSDEKVVITDPNIRLIGQPNKGAPAARNKGFEVSKGEYVLFCDADVVMKPNMLARMLCALQSDSKASYAYSSFYFGFKKFTVPTFSAGKLKGMNYIHTTSLIRRADFPKFDESLRRFQDWDLWLTMLSQGKVGVGISEVLFSVKPRRLGISHWLPSFAYRFSKLPAVSKYNDAKHIIKTKHAL